MKLLIDTGRVAVAAHQNIEAVAGGWEVGFAQEALPLPEVPEGQEAPEPEYRRVPGDLYPDTLGLALAEVEALPGGWRPGRWRLPEDGAWEALAEPETPPPPPPRYAFVEPLAFKALVTRHAGLEAWKAARAHPMLEDANEALTLSRRGVDPADLVGSAGYWAACVTLGMLAQEQVDAIMADWPREAA